MLAVSRTVHHLGAYPQAGPSGLGADPVTRPRRAYLHLSCSKAAAFGLHFSSLLLLPSWHTLAKDRSRAVFPAASHLATKPDGPAKFILNPMAWWTWAETRYETPLTMRYEHLDPKASYKVRVVSVGNPTDPKIKLVANEKVQVHGWIQKPAAMGPAFESSRG